MSCRNTTSIAVPVVVRRRRRSSLLAMPGMRSTPPDMSIPECPPIDIDGSSAIHTMCLPVGQRGHLPQPEPALHAADLLVLRRLDVVGELLQRRVGGVVPLPRRHLDGLAVVHGHVLGEPDVDGVLGRRRRRPDERPGHHGDHQDRHHGQAEHGHRPPGRPARLRPLRGDLVAGVGAHRPRMPVTGPARVRVRARPERRRPARPATRPGCRGSPGTRSGCSPRTDGGLGWNGGGLSWSK